MGKGGACHNNPKLDIPIIIGTYPILDDLSLNSAAQQNSMPAENLPDIKKATKGLDEECESELEVILTGRGESIPLRTLKTNNATSENAEDHATIELRNSLCIAQQPASSRISDLEIILAGLDQEMAEKLIQSAAVLPYPEKGNFSPFWIEPTFCLHCTMIFLL